MKTDTAYISALDEFILEVNELYDTEVFAKDATVGLFLKEYFDKLNELKREYLQKANVLRQEICKS